MGDWNLKRVELVDSLKCDCGGTYGVIAFITEYKVIRKILRRAIPFVGSPATSDSLEGARMRTILEHLEKVEAASRAPPES
jgi:hypothetical protein